MYVLRKAGANHYAMYAGDRVDYQITQNPDFARGRLKAEFGVNLPKWPARIPEMGGWDTKRNLRHGTSGVDTRLIRASARDNLPRLTSPTNRQTLKERALTRARSTPSREFASSMRSTGSVLSGDVSEAVERAQGKDEQRELASMMRQTLRSSGPTPWFNSFQANTPEVMNPQKVGRWKYVAPPNMQEGLTLKYGDLEP
mmetsp:Transcript_31908/g.58448  ORF Transcript_31908/g.58448 Transcript_31908/m.58448 type:complete len:199 (-) Transcript_31908:151-747(-)